MTDEPFLIQVIIIPFQNNDMILFIDVFVYSGGQMGNNLNQIFQTFDTSRKINDINIFLLCLYISQIGLSVISRSYAEVFDRSENSCEIGEFSQNK